MGESDGIILGMLSLDSPYWAQLEHAYGSASDIPTLLRQLKSLSPLDAGHEPWFSLWSALAHQGDVYSASFAAVPHVIHALSSSPERADASYFQFPAWVEICRQKKAVPIPEYLATAYFDALAQLPRLIAEAASSHWDSDFLASALSALAAAKGFGTIAEAALELTPEVADEFMDWLSKR